MGKKGDIIEVSDSYGRNVLIRRGLGKEGSVGNLNTARQQQASRDHKAQVAADEAVIMAAQLKKGDIEAEGSYRRGRTDFSVRSHPRISARLLRSSMDSNWTRRILS